MSSTPATSANRPLREWDSIKGDNRRRQHATQGPVQAEVKRKNGHRVRYSPGLRLLRALPLHHESTWHGMEGAAPKTVVASRYMARRLREMKQWRS
ncbi:hypothetical protein PR202_ga31087 [Eleusine coracana subsp. coracana]|uniref:Uncharacterized protein n=1 Tax=Eleusine coracana subsp. coracana TaxID=191504 RepID=A0AAV5DRP2_ELECO|nr:hypothetical protein PR202_ga31087 [Eleusine coracana subsp. coracana]